ncbi:MAG: DUF2190 family protein [Cloacibacillus sp.]
MKNYVAPGYNIKATLATAVSSGDGVVIGDLFAVAVNNYAANTEGIFALKGIFALPKKTGDTFSAGCKVYWDTTNGYVTTTSTSNTHAGWYVDADGDKAQVRLRL